MLLSLKCSQKNQIISLEWKFLWSEKCQSWPGPVHTRVEWYSTFFSQKSLHPSTHPLFTDNFGCLAKSSISSHFLVKKKHKGKFFWRTLVKIQSSGRFYKTYFCIKLVPTAMKIWIFYRKVHLYCTVLHMNSWHLYCTVLHMNSWHLYCTVLHMNSWSLLLVMCELVQLSLLYLLCITSKCCEKKKFEWCHSPMGCI